MTSRQRQAAARAKRRLDVADVMSKPAGRRYVWGLANLAGVHAASYTDDARQTAFNEGRRSMGLELLAEAQRAARESYVAMLTELLPEESFEPEQQATETEDAVEP